MGRLNYTNRKIEGIKLGQVVNKDLVKRIPPNTGCKAAFRDPALELDISSKALTDEGFFEVASALVEALAYDGAQGRCARLEELCLKDNRLTISSLQALTPVIELACRDLRDLDLSANLITIETEDEIAIWEGFLIAFGRCCTLRRIDWSSNALGSNAFEVLLRVYAKEGPVHLRNPSNIEQVQDGVQASSSVHGAVGLKSRKTSIVSDECEHSVEDESPRSHQRKGSRQDSKSPEKANAATQANLQSLYATTHGLRSVPYLVCGDISMTDACALHLSYVIENHHLPRHLLPRVPPVKAGPLAHQLISYDEELHCQGIAYRPNERLSNNGIKVLELAEKRREIQFGNTDEGTISTFTNSKKSGKPPRRQSMQDEEGTDLERVRSRIQGNTLQEAGPLSNQLWRAALKMLVLARNIQDVQLPKKDYHATALTPMDSTAQEAPKSKGRGPIIKTLTIPGYVKPQSFKPRASTESPVPLEPFPRLKTFPPLKPLTPLLTEKDPNRSIKPWESSHRKKSESIPSHPNVTSLNLDIETSKPASDKKTPSRTDKMYRTGLPCGFAEHVWARILGQYAGVDGILSADQQLSVLRYAMDRKTLSKESEVLGLTVAAQIWRILEATDCLTYEIDL